MFTLSDDIVEAREQIEEAKRVTAVPTNRDIPTTPSLTGRQLYVQFCYRMAKFDLEFATMDPVMVQSWLNTGLSRMLHEFEKRFLANPGDRSAKRIFSNALLQTELNLTPPVAGSFVWKADLGPRDSQLKLFPDPLDIYIRYNEIFTNVESNCPDVPNWWPYTYRATTLTRGTFTPNEVHVGYLELEGTDERKQDFWISNSFSELECGVRSRVWIKRMPGGFPIYIHVGDRLNNRGPDGVINQTKLPPSEAFAENLGFEVTKVIATLYNFDSLLDLWFIKTDSEQYLLDFPVEYYNDIIDYTIDAYFESMFFHQFGKYSMKQGRQDADGTPTTVNRTQKLDAVPPQRYRVGAGA